MGLMQLTRLVQVDCPLGPDVLLLQRMEDARNWDGCSPTSCTWYRKIPTCRWSSCSASR